MDKNSVNESIDTSKRPFKGVFAYIFFFAAAASFIFLALASDLSAFTVGSIISITWASAIYVFDLDQIHPSINIKNGRAALGFSSFIAGILIAAVGPNYLNTQGSTTDWFVMWGFLIFAQIGISLLFVSPLRSLSVCAGFLISAVILHSVIIRLPNDFSDINGARVLVLLLLIISSWYLAQWIFFDRSALSSKKESKNTKRVKSFVGIASGLITVIEFFNILYNLFGN